MASPFQRRFAATALLAAMALPVLAQQPPATPTAASAKAPDARHERRHGDHAQRHAKHLAELKAQLKLTAAQEPAWTSFTTALQPGERDAQSAWFDLAVPAGGEARLTYTVRYRWAPDVRID